MDQTKQVLGGFFSPVSNWNSHTDIHNENHLTSHTNIVEKNQHHQDINIYSNSSKVHILPVSGSHNRGWMFNDALFNVTNIFQRPIFLNLNQYPLLHYSIVASTVCFFIFSIFVILLYFIYYPQSRRRRQQQQQQQQQDRRLYYLLSSNKHPIRLSDRNSFVARHKKIKAKFIRQQYKEGDVDDHNGNHKSVTITDMHASQETDKVSISATDCFYLFHVHYVYT